LTTGRLRSPFKIMKYLYTRYTLGTATGTTENFDDISESDVAAGSGNVVQVTEKSTNKMVAALDSTEALEAFRIGLERYAVWGPKAGTAVHYQNYFEDLQWIDAMAKIPRYREPAVFKAAVELQIRKYLDRVGKKDDELQELMKARWYLNYLCAYIKAGNVPIKASDVDRILG